MFFFLRKKSLVKRAALTGAVLVLLTGLLFVSCADPVGGGSGSTVTNAQTPTISVQPTGGSWNVSTDDTKTLTVTASVTDGGTLTYQWYSNSTNSNSGGTAINTGGTGTTLTLAKTDYATDGSYYFYVVVTNTNNNATGTKTATKTSDTATVTVSGNGGSTPEVDISFLYGTWYSTNSGIDFFIIDTTAKTLEYASGWGQEGTFTGKIHNVVTDTSGTGTSGVIYIEFTAKPEVYGTGEPVEGDYTGIYFKDVQSATSQGFYLPVDDSYIPVTTSTLAEAEMTLTLADIDTYVTMTIEYAKIDGGNGGIHSSPLEGAWTDEWDTTFTITKTTVVSAMDMGGYAIPLFVGDIFKVVTKNSNTEGYIVFRYVGVFDDDLVGTYSVLYWKSLTANSVKMAIAGDDYTGGIEAGEATAAAAEAKYSGGNASYFDFTDFDKQ